MNLVLTLKKICDSIVVSTKESEVVSMTVKTIKVEVTKVSVVEDAPERAKKVVEKFNTAKGNLVLEVTPCGGDDIETAIALGDYIEVYPEENEFSEELLEVEEWLWIDEDHLVYDKSVNTTPKVTPEDKRWTKWCYNSGVKSAFKGRRVRA